MIIGITGGTGCGKTTALEAIRALGGLVLDCDAIYHKLLETDAALLQAIEDRFPGVVEEGVLQRKKLGAIVFSDPAALLDLNRITHRAVEAQVLAQLADAPKLAAIDAIALFESGLNRLCDRTVAVTAPEDTRIARLIARDGISEEYAAARIAAQPPQSYFREKCDFTLVNDCTRQAFYDKCLAFFRSLAIIKET
jgi:dephospho-CoA kinase